MYIQVKKYLTHEPFRLWNLFVSALIYGLLVYLNVGVSLYIILWEVVGWGKYRELEAVPNPWSYCYRHVAEGTDDGSNTEQQLWGLISFRQ